MAIFFEKVVNFAVELENSPSFNKSMIKRDAESFVLRLAKQFPIVTILGPRQSGKTTLARNAFPQYRYVNLELPDVRLFAERDPRAFLEANPAPVILDEIQNVPALLSYLQVFADEPGAPGRYVLTGSHQPRLGEAVSQSLAGRTGILRLLPLSLSELESAGVAFSRDSVLLNGFMPRLYGGEACEPTLLYANYYATYVERDLRQLINVKNLAVFDVFVRLLAGRVGQVLNLSSLSGDAGVSVQTAKEWLSVLEASFIVFRTFPYFENFGKRLTKSPKLYFYEPGLAAYLLNLRTPEQVARDPLVGGLFENMVVAEAKKTLFNRGEDGELYFWRDERGFEIDLLARRGNVLFPIEIKSGKTFSDSFAKNLVAFRKITPRAGTGAVIYAGEQEANINGVRFMNFSKTRDCFR